MEILRFEEAATSAPKRKKSSKGFITAGFVAAVFGIGTALASATTTIEINNDEGISLGQGVTLATACDTEIGLAPITEMILTADEPIFYLAELQINGVDAKPANTDTGLGCGSKYFDLQIFNPTTKAAYACNELQPFPGVDPTYAGKIKIFQGAGQFGITCADSKISFQVREEAGAIAESDYTIKFLKAPSDISYVTLVTRNNA
jgi:hypothetical protein